MHLVRRRVAAPGSGHVVLSSGTRCYAYYSGTAPGADRSLQRFSNFMYMALQRVGRSSAAFAMFDFGRSRKDAGAFRLQEVHQGFEPQPLVLPLLHLVEEDRKLPSFNPSNPKTKILRDTWQKLPPWLALKLSSKLARYLP